LFYARPVSPCLAFMVGKDTGLSIPALYNNAKETDRQALNFPLNLFIYQLCTSNTMPTAPTIAKPVFKPHISFQVEPEQLEERCTIVHCILPEETLARIWPTTFLVQPDGVRKKLLQAYHITEYPYWTYAEAGHCFTLVFEGLNRSCTLFDLFEDIPQPGGFHIRDIRRNQQDVYTLEIS
jgi:hypothetical protein